MESKNRPPNLFQTSALLAASCLYAGFVGTRIIGGFGLNQKSADVLMLIASENLAFCISMVFLLLIMLGWWKRPATGVSFVDRRTMAATKKSFVSGTWTIATRLAAFVVFCACHATSQLATMKSWSTKSALIGFSPISLVEA